jgi:small-conductance mechanosensitive channel
VVDAGQESVMNELTGQDWFWPALAVVIGLPVLLLVCTELHAFLVRRHSSFAKPVLMLRNYILPVFALLLLIDQVNDTEVEATWTRIIATVFGFLIILFVLSGANAVLFGEARSGTWRDRLPSIFVDLGRLVLIIISLGVLFSWVWGTDVGGLFTALGVTSIVIGLALQNAVGPIIAGLLLLFEQPFKIGDWLDTAVGKGRVVEVNWRAVHIDTGNGLQIIPNAMLATGSFTNLSRIQGPTFNSVATVQFSLNDQPGLVASTLLSVARDLPLRNPLLDAKVTDLGEGQYKIAVPVNAPADEGPTKTVLLHRAWYSARRAGLHLDDVEYTRDGDHEVMVAELARISTTLQLGSEDAEVIVRNSRLLQYCEGEVVQRAGTVPGNLLFIVEGTVVLLVDSPSGILDVGELSAGDYLGMTTLTRQKAITAVHALTDTTVIQVPRATIEPIVRRNPALAKRLDAAIEVRRRMANEALAETGSATGVDVVNAPGGRGSA